MNILKDFTGQYPLSKTLRFELKPIGKTLEYIEKSGMLSDDEKYRGITSDVIRAESYKDVKKIIDEYHKAFIEESLVGIQLDETMLNDYFSYYSIPKREDSQKKKFTEKEKELRKQIANAFKKHAKYGRLFKKELITEDLPAFLSDENKKKLVWEFKTFTTYFTGFHENRANMYSDEDKSTAIAYRLIHQNLPRFLDNMRSFEKINNSAVKDNFSKIQTELKSILQIQSVEDFFQLNAFSNTLTQAGIDRYNNLIGGYVPEEGEKIQGLNEYINLYNQTAAKSERLPKLKELYKQILSDRSSASFIPEQFKDDQEVLESIKEFYSSCETTINSIKILLQTLHEFDLKNIYLRKDLSLTDISQKYLGHWDIIQRNIESQLKKKNKESDEKYAERKEKYFKSMESLSIKDINNCLQLSDELSGKKIEDYFALLGKTDENQTNVFTEIAQNYKIIEELLHTDYPQDKNLAQNTQHVEQIKVFLDSLKSLQRFIKPLLGKGNEAEKDERFYEEFSKLWDKLNKLTPLYDKVRNYMTRKPYSTEKIKLNFEKGYFLNGWVQEYGSKVGLIYLYNGNYYLGVTNKLSKKDINELKATGNNDIATRIILDFQKPDNKNTPRLFIRSKGENYAPAVSEYNLPIEQIIDIYDKNKFQVDYRKINEVEYSDSLHKLIDYFKLGFSTHQSYKHYAFQWKLTTEYENIAEFYHDTEISCYQVKEERTSWDTLLKLVEEGKIYLFQIYNKDFSPYSKGTPNMHTMYWKALFDAENLKDVVYKLNGQAEVFFRKKSIFAENKIVHKAKNPIDNKNKQNKNKQSTFDYDIIKNKRYTVDKFQFHVPITLNFKSTGNENVNEKVNHCIQNNKIQHIIGIDRGERHLLYLSLIDLKGKILKQYSLNEIVNEYNGNTYKTDYHALLDKRENNRNEARKTWKTIETIKELKEGYISQVVHKIAQLVVEYNAIVVLEDLNSDFKRGRQKVERSVYQKFEKMLIDKLNYLVDKKKSINEDGGLLKAYQLTNKFESFQKMGKQNGFLFYVQAWNTSKIDPVTGFVNMFDTRYENVEKAKAFFEKFADIRFAKNNDYFEFIVDDYSKFNPKLLTSPLGHPKYFPRNFGQIIF